MASKEPIYGVVEISMHGVKRARADWLKGREEHEMAELDLSSQSKDGRRMGLIVDFTANVIGLAYEVTEAGADDAVVEMNQPMENWRTKHPPRDDSHEAWQKAWADAQAKKPKGEPEPQQEPQQA